MRPHFLSNRNNVHGQPAIPKSGQDIGGSTMGHLALLSLADVGVYLREFYGNRQSLVLERDPLVQVAG